MTCMRDQTSLNFGLIRPPTGELAALERLKNPYRLIMGEWCCSFFSAVLDRILFILACNNDIHESFNDFEKLPDLTTDHRVRCPLGSKK